LMRGVSANSQSKAWEESECDQQFGANERIHIGISQRLRKVGDAGIIKVLAMRPGFGKINDNLYMSRNVQILETNFSIPAIACCIDYTDTRSSKQIHSLSTIQWTNCRTIYWVC
jgi:hypothetical protein